jgi:IPT/TIG domain
MRNAQSNPYGKASRLALSVLTGVASGGIMASRVWAAPAPTPAPAPATPVAPTPDVTATATPSPGGPGVPLIDVAGSRAVWFIGLVAGAVALLWALPLIYDTWEANRWRRSRQASLLEKMINRAGRMSVEEIRQIVSAIDTQPRGTVNLTQSLLGLIIATFVGVALVATLVSNAADSSDLRKTIVTALLSILGTIAGFYFGARTAQTAAEQATRPPESRPRTELTGGPAPTGGPTLGGVTPSSGPAAGGTPVVLEGSGFTGTTAVTFGSTPASGFTVDSDQLLTAVTPPGEGTVDITVTTPRGGSTPSAAARFTYASPG